MNKKTAIIAAVLLAFVSGTKAETLTIDSCRALALQYNKEKQSAALTTRQAEYVRKSTKALFFPNFSLQAFGAYDTSKGTHPLDFNNLLGPTLAGLAPALASMGITLPSSLPTYDLKYKVGWLYSGSLLMTQPLYMGGKIRAGYNMAKTAVEMAKQNERLTDAQVIQQADEAYAKVVKATELVGVAERYGALLKELDRNVESAVRHGLKLQNDQMKVRVKMNEVELQLRRAQNGVRLAKMNLCHVIGRPLLSEVEVNPNYPEVDDALALQTADISQRPEMAILEYQNEMARQKVALTRSEMLPTVALLAKYGYLNALELNDKTLLDGWNFTGGVTVSIPLYHFGEHTNKLKAAKAQEEQTRLERENKGEMMMLELTQAANNLDEARLEAQLSEKSLEQAEVNMNLSGQQYEAGFETLSDYLEAQAQWQQAYETKVDAHFRLYLSSVAYLKAAGRLVE